MEELQAAHAAELQRLRAEHQVRHDFHGWRWYSVWDDFWGMSNGDEDLFCNCSTVMLRMNLFWSFDLDPRCIWIPLTFAITFDISSTSFEPSWRSSWPDRMKIIRQWRHSINCTFFRSLIRIMWICHWARPLWRRRLKSSRRGLNTDSWGRHPMAAMTPWKWWDGAPTQDFLHQHSRWFMAELLTRQSRTFAWGLPRQRTSARENGLWGHSSLVHWFVFTGLCLWVLQVSRVHWVFKTLSF